MITRREFGRGAVGSVLVGALQRAHSATARRPNVLLVVADEWRAQSLGYAGDSNAHTPAIDRFASQSVNFEQAISGCSVCCPARASIVTGQYPLTNGVYINDVPLAPKAPTLGEVFRDAGYSTGYIGKWHLYGSPDGRYNRREAYIPPDKRFGFEYWKVAECTHDYNKSHYYEGDDTTKKFWAGYDAAAQTDDACRYIQKHAGESSPFFLTLAWGPPHFPLHSAPQKYQDMYRAREIRLRPNVPASNRNKAIEDLRGYYAHIAALDDCFQELLDALDTAGIAEDTVVVFTSDHGDMMESQGLSYKLYPWEESVRVPLLIRYPRKFGRSGRRSTALLNSPDVMPTLLGLCGIEAPTGIQGVDFSHSNSPAQARLPTSSAFLCLPVPIGEALRYGFAEYRGIRTARHTYVRSIDGPWLLYDNQKDPYQARNLCGRTDAAKIQAGLDRDLNAWLTALGDEFLPARTYLERAGLAHYLETQFPIGHVRSAAGDWQSTLRKPPGFSSRNSSLGELLDHPRAREVLDKELPGLATVAASSERLRGFSLRLVQQFAVMDISDAALESIDRELIRISERR
jgi:arylsulfatase A-like enzyme